MNTRDDDLDRLFRAARPNRQFERNLSATEIALRESIIRGTRTTRLPRARPKYIWAGLTTAAASLAVAAIVTLNVLAPDQHAIALTPPELQYSSAPQLAEVVDGAQESLRTAPGPTLRSHVEYVVWGWSAEIEEERIESVPQAITFDWAPGDPATTTILAAESFWDDTERPTGMSPSPYEPGELIDEMVVAPEDFGAPEPLVNLTDGSREALEAALSVFGATEGSSSDELLAAIDGVMQYWTLSNAQHAMLLDLLMKSDDIDVLGTTTDRVGREVIGLAVPSAVPERTSTVFVATATGRLVGIESELTKPLDGLPAGVISYSMWDSPK